MLAAYACAVLFWIAQSMVLPEPRSEAFFATMAIHGLGASILAAAAWNRGADRRAVPLLLGLVLWPVASPYATTLLLALLFGALARREPDDETLARMLRREQARWLLRGGAGAALAVGAAYILLLPHLEGQAGKPLPIWADPLARGRHGISTLAKAAFLLVALRYLFWIRGSLRLFRECVRKPPPLR